MSPRYKAKTKATTAKANTQLPTINPHAAGIDIGATSLQVAVPSDADPKPVRTFTTFTDDLLKLRTAVQNRIFWMGETPVLLVNSGNHSHFSKSVGHPEVRMLSKSSTS